MQTDIHDAQKEKTAILIDSGCDVSDTLIQRYNMKLHSLHVIYPEEDYLDDDNITPQTVYRLSLIHI